MIAISAVIAIANAVIHAQDTACTAYNWAYACLYNSIGDHVVEALKCYA